MSIMPASTARRELRRNHLLETVWKVPTGTEPGLHGPRRGVKRPYFRVVGERSSLVEAPPTDFPDSLSRHSGEQVLGPDAWLELAPGDAFPAANSPIARSLPRRASGGLFQGSQSRRAIHAGAPYEVHRRGVDLVDERVDAQVARQVLVLLEQRAGLAGGL